MPHKTVEELRAFDAACCARLNGEYTGMRDGERTAACLSKLERAEADGAPRSGLPVKSIESRSDCEDDDDNDVRALASGSRFATAGARGLRIRLGARR
jgi:hypothetical protein